MKTCPSCIEFVPDDAHHCGHCGSAIEPAPAQDEIAPLAGADPGTTTPDFVPSPPDFDESAPTVAMTSIDPALFAEHLTPRGAGPPIADRSPTIPMIMGDEHPAAASAQPPQSDPPPAVEAADPPVAAPPMAAPPMAPPTVEAAPPIAAQPIEAAPPIVAPPVEAQPIEEAPLDVVASPIVAAPMEAAPPGMTPAEEAAPPAVEIAPTLPAPSPVDEPPAPPVQAASSTEGPLKPAPPDPGPRDAAATLIMESPLGDLKALMEERRAADLAAAAPANAGFEDSITELQVGGGGTGRSIAWVGLIAVPILGAMTAAAIFFGGGQLRLRFDSRVAWDAPKSVYQVTLGVIIEEGAPDERLALEFRGERQEFEGNGAFTYRVPREALKVGVNDLDAVVKTPDGTEVGRFTATIMVDYEVEVRRTVLGPEDKDFTAHFKIGEGAQLLVERGRVTPAGEGRVAVKVGLNDLLKRIDTLPTADYPYSLRFRIRRPDGSEVPHAQQIDLTLPTAALEVFRPARETTIKAKKIQISGRADPGGEVVVAGKRVPVDEKGAFSVKIKLAKGDNKITVLADRRGVIDRQTVLDVRRVSGKELATIYGEAQVAGEDWAGEDALRAETYERIQAGAAGDLKGKKVVLKGQLSSLQQGPSKAVLLIDLCPKKPVCILWAETDDRVTVDVGAKVTLFGTLAGTKALPGEGGEVPAADAHVVLGR